MDELESGEETSLNWGGVYTMAQWKNGKPMYVEVMIEGQQVKMELGTGAVVSLLPYQVYQENFAHLPLDKTQVRLKIYTGEHVLPRGLIVVEVWKGTESQCKITSTGCGWNGTTTVWPKLAGKDPY